MKQEHINFIRLRYSTLENIPPFIIIGGETVEFNLSYCVVYEYMYGWYKSLLDETKDVDVVQPSMNYISLKCRISLSTAKRVMKHLEQAGLIVVERTKGESNKYVCVRELNCAEWSDKQRTRSDTKGTKHDVTKQQPNTPKQPIKKITQVEYCGSCYREIGECICEIPF
jgi:predicted transcriptional regulator